MSEKLWHYSEDPLRIDPGRVYDVDSDCHVFSKPCGLWVSVEGEDDWLSWCRAEEFRPEALRYRHRVIVNPGAKVLRIDDSAGMDALEARFAEQRSTHMSKENLIDWAKVKTEYQGIIIAPYQWGYRLELRWYYGWDCASGCIWDMRVVNVGSAERVD